MLQPYNFLWLLGGTTLESIRNPVGLWKNSTCIERGKTIRILNLNLNLQDIPVFCRDVVKFNGVAVLGYDFWLIHKVTILILNRIHLIFKKKF
jgi:hypothetical protein